MVGQITVTPVTSLTLDYLSWPALAGLYAALATPIVLMARGTLSGLGMGRKVSALAIRLALLGILLLVIGGIRWERMPNDLDVIVLRDVSASVEHVERSAGSRNVQDAMDRYLTAIARRNDKPPADRIGVISFRSRPALDAAPQTTLTLNARGVRDLGSGTDLSSALDLAMASMDRDTMHRVLLAWDGNVTSGDVDAAVARLIAARVPVDVMPLRYDLSNEVVVDRLSAPSWRRAGEPFSLDVAIRSTSSEPVKGHLRVTDNGVDLNLAGAAGSRSAMPVTLRNGTNVLHVTVPATAAAGVHRFRAVFEADAPPTEGAVHDSIVANNSAEAFTFVSGRSRVLFVDDMPVGASDPLLAVLRREGIDVQPSDHIAPASMSDDPVLLQNYDAVILANVPRGSGGLDASQERALVAYVNDLGGGLVAIGGPDAFGAGGWQGSALEQVLPLEMDVPARKVVPRGALMLVLDHSGSMGGPLGDRSKQGAVNEAAVLALKALSPQDLVGVIAFDAGFEWVAPLGPNVDAAAVSERMRTLAPGGGTAIYPGLAEAVRALSALPESEASARHVLLLTDGQSTPGDYDALLQSMVGSGISLSTVGVGADHDAALLQRLAQLGKGRYYPVNDAAALPQVFIKETRVVRRSLIKEDRRGIAVQTRPTTSDWTAGLTFDRPIHGLVLTGRKAKAGVEVPLVAGSDNDPLLAHWQAGLGRAAAFTSDASARWASAYVDGPQFGKFWSQVIRGVSRPAMSADFDLRAELIDGSDRARITVDARRADNAFANFAAITGAVLRPDGTSQRVRLAQSGPGLYTADVAAAQAGVYAIGLTVGGQNLTGGTLRGGLVVNDAAELRPLRSDEAALRSVADRTGGRMLPAWDVAAADVYRREDLHPTPLALPVWDVLLAAGIALFLLDVSARRIALTWTDARRLAHAAADQVRGFTLTTRAVEDAGTLAALRVARDEMKTPADERRWSMPSATTGRTGEDVVGGHQHATSRPSVGGPPNEELNAATSSTMESLLGAKRRANPQCNRDNIEKDVHEP